MGKCELWPIIVTIANYRAGHKIEGWYCYVLFVTPYDAETYARYV